MPSSSPWPGRVRDLADRIRVQARATLIDALECGRLEDIARPVGIGVGDVTYGLDLPTENICSEWLEEIARTEPLSLLTEDTGWRHRGPKGDLDGFDHGGPRIALDPIDGTRNLMTDLRSAWTVVSFAESGCGMPDLSDLTLGLVAEIPSSRARSYRVLEACIGTGCRLEERVLDDDELISEGPLVVDEDDRADHGYFPFFRYDRKQNPTITRIECAFLDRLEKHENADVRNCYDDQYISNAGQLFLLATGTYRSIADLRAWLAKREGRPAITSKPYDCAGAILCAREAGAIVTAPGGTELDFPIDAITPVSFVGWANRATEQRLGEHLREALAESAPFTSESD